tara:strand:+ start:373 stop:762 length:390 start_codon:yes stop_codon:yes gene_type:complete
MQEKFIVEIITPDRSLLKSEASEVIIPSYEGEMGILKDHIPLITFLRPGLITIKSDKVQKFYAEEGTVEFSKNNLLILTTTVKTIDDIEATFIEKSIKSAEENMDKSDLSDKDKYLLSYKIGTLKELRK